MLVSLARKELRAPGVHLPLHKWSNIISSFSSGALHVFLRAETAAAQCLDAAWYSEEAVIGWSGSHWAILTHHQLILTPHLGHGTSRIYSFQRAAWKINLEVRGRGTGKACLWCVGSDRNLCMCDPLKVSQISLPWFEGNGCDTGLMDGHSPSAHAHWGKPCPKHP